MSETTAINGNENPESGKPEPKPTPNPPSNPDPKPEPPHDPEPEDTPEPTDNTTPDDPPTDPKVETARKEAATYRTKLRKTEAERDQLQKVIDTMQTKEVDEHLEDLPAGAFWAGYDGAISDLRTEDGTIDPTKVMAAEEQTRIKLGFPATGPLTPRQTGWQSTRSRSDFAGLTYRQQLEKAAAEGDKQAARRIQLLDTGKPTYSSSGPLPSGEKPLPDPLYTQPNSNGWQGVINPRNK